MITLGMKVKDKLTGFTGTATAKAEYLYGCVWICIEANKLQDGKPVECWFDEPRIEEIKVKKKAISDTEPTYRKRYGPPGSMPSRGHPSPANMKS